MFFFISKSCKFNVHTKYFGIFAVLANSHQMAIRNKSDVSQDCTLYQIQDDSENSLSVTDSVSRVNSNGFTDYNEQTLNRYYDGTSLSSSLH